MPVEYLLSRGQQIKVFSVVLYKARQLGFLCPDDKAIGTDGKYEGATVLDAKRGAYFDVVSGLDFASLYPSIIRAHALDYATIVLDPRYANLPGVEYYEVETGMGSFRFAQGVPAVLPSLLEDLAQFRKQAKKDMAAAKARGDTWAANLYNGKQNAYKITMNSCYGFAGATKGFLPCVPIAASVTATGRAMIQKTRDLAEALAPGSQVVYGDTDSVMVIFDVGEERRHDLRAHFDMAQRVADQISATFKAPIELEFEKCYYPYLLFSKKRYAGEFFSWGQVIMRVLSWILAVWLMMIAADATMGWPAFRNFVEWGVHLYCSAVGPEWDREQCTARTFYSRRLWAVVAAGAAAGAWTVATDALKGMK